MPAAGPKLQMVIDGNTITMHGSGVITSPWDFAFGFNGQVVSGVVVFNESTGNIANIRLDRSAGPVPFGTLQINGQNIATPNPGGSLTITSQTLSGFGINVFSDIQEITMVA